MDKIFEKDEEVYIGALVLTKFLGYCGASVGPVAQLVRAGGS